MLKPSERRYQYVQDGLWYDKTEDIFIESNCKIGSYKNIRRALQKKRKKMMIGKTADTISIDDLYAAKEMLVKANIPYGYGTIELGNCFACGPNIACEQPVPWPTQTIQASAKRKQPNKETTKENTMGYAAINVTAATAVDNTTRDQREHLLERLSSVRCEKRDELTEKFFMGPVKLETIEAVEAAMKDGTIQVDKDYADKNGNLSWFSTTMLRIVNPKRDEAGFKAANVLLGKSYTDAKDKIIILPVEKGLEALGTFEAATF